jgi:hypothetical protein
MAPEALPPRLSIGRLAPAVLVAGLVLDAASRFVSYDRVAFRAWEAMTRTPPARLGGTFTPNKRFEIEDASGDLSSLSNRPWMRQSHHEVFTTDAFGFRNLPEASTRASGVMIGTSFTVGSTLNDEDTFPVQLGGLVGVRIYNAASIDVANPLALDALLDRLRLPPGSPFIVECFEATDPALGPRPSSRVATRLERLLGSEREGLLDGYAALRTWLAPSPLQIALVRAHKRLEDDTLLPNSAAPAARLARFPNGDSMLFHLDEDPTKRPVEGWARAFRQLADRVEARRLRPLVVLVPSASTVYTPMLEPQPPTMPSSPYLDRLGSALRAAGVPYVDVTPAMEEAARRAFRERRYLYWRDDTHWNKDGVAVAARVVADALRRP